MIELELKAVKLQTGLLPLIWALSVVAGGRVAAGTGAAEVVFGWQLLFLFLLPILLPIRYLLATILAAVVFFDASLWFQMDNPVVDAIYESPGAAIKPPEFLLLALVLRLMVMRGNKHRLPLGFRTAIAVWITVILFGGVVALLLSRPAEEILTFSEIRSPIVMIILVIALVPFFTISPRFFIDYFGIFIIGHFFVSLLSWGGGISLLWASFAPNYFGLQSAFFGGDESVMVYLLSFTIALCFLLSPPDHRLSGFGRKFWLGILLMSAFAILASLRRGGVISMLLVVSVLFMLMGMKAKLRVLIACVALIPLTLFIADRTGVLEAVIGRLQGEGMTAQSDAGRATDIAQALDFISEHFWFGGGAGTRLAMLRTQAYGVSETLSIHSGPLHVWVRFGFFGLLSYVLLFAYPVLYGFSLSRRIGKSDDGAALSSLALSMATILLALFVWTLVTPAIFINFRQAAVWSFAVTLIFSLRIIGSGSMRGKGLVEQSPYAREEADVSSRLLYRKR